MSNHTIVSTPAVPKTLADIQQLLDSAAVQDGDVIELKGSFSATLTDALYLWKSVTLKSHPDQAASIVGGQQLQWGVTPQKKKTPVAATIDGILFKGFSIGAIRIQATKGDNFITNCRFEDYTYGVKVPGVLEGAWPIVGGASGSPQDVSGNLTISDCFFGAPLAASVPAGGMNNLLHINNCDLQHLLISKNTIEDMYWMGLVVFGVSGLTEIVENTITRKSTWAARHGTGVGIAFGVRPPSYPMDRDGSLILERNTINIDNADSYGIVVGLYPESAYLPSPNAATPRSITVRDNVVNMHGDVSGVKNDRAALACLGACADATWSNNIVTGTSRFGIRVSQEVLSVVAPSSEGPRNLLFQENNLAGGSLKDPTDSTVKPFGPFTASQAQVFVDRTAEKVDVRLNTLGPVSGSNISDWPPPLDEPCAGITWHGFDGEIASNDLANSDIMGWSAGPRVGGIYLSPMSSGNLVEYHPSDFPKGTVPPPEEQILDLAKPNTIKVAPKVKPKKLPVSLEEKEEMQPVLAGRAHTNEKVPV